MSHDMFELLWLKGLRELGFSGGDPLTLHFKDRATSHIASNHVYHKLMQCVEVDCHLTLEKVSKEI